MVKRGFGKRDGKQRGLKQGGQGRNQTADCRHPPVKKNRKK